MFCGLLKVLGSTKDYQTSFTKTTSFKLGDTLWSMGREIFAEETLEAVERLHIEKIVEKSQIKRILKRL